MTFFVLAGLYSHPLTFKNTGNIDYNLFVDIRHAFLHTGQLLFTIWPCNIRGIIVNNEVRLHLYPFFFFKYYWSFKEPFLSTSFFSYLKKTENTISVCSRTSIIFGFWRVFFRYWVVCHMNKTELILNTKICVELYITDSQFHHVKLPS